jgi:hypothetical protein
VSENFPKDTEDYAIKSEPHDCRQEGHDEKDFEDVIEFHWMNPKRRLKTMRNTR